MSDEIAKKLGYTDEEIRAEKHIAAKIELKEAIQLGMVVNPKVVSCEYNLLTDGSMENLPSWATMKSERFWTKSTRRIYGRIL